MFKKLSLGDYKWISYQEVKIRLLDIKIYISAIWIYNDMVNVTDNRDTKHIK